MPTPRAPAKPSGALPGGLGKPARRALESAGYTCLERLAEASEAELGRLHGVGPKAIRQLREALAAVGRSLAAPAK
jgi:hypothetical protein